MSNNWFLNNGQVLSGRSMLSLFHDLLSLRNKTQQLIKKKKSVSGQYMKIYTSHAKVLFVTKLNVFKNKMSHT